MLKYIFWGLVFLSILLRFFWILPKYKDGDTLRISARVLEEPLVFNNSSGNSVQYFSLKGLKVYLPRYPEINYGDRVVLEGVANKGKLTNPKLLKIEKTNNTLMVLRQRIVLVYKQNLSEPHASLVAGMVLGSKAMPEGFWEVLRKTGTAHVVVASGTNVTLVASFLLAVLTYFISRRRAIYIVFIGILVYVVLSGFDAPIVRASIMGGLTFLLQIKGKVVYSLRILIYTAIIMLFVNPGWITDLGFILSFVATFSILVFQTKIDLKLKALPVILREGLSTSLAAQIGVAPIIFLTFGQFNIFSPLINALVLWTVGYIMIIGALGGLIGLIFPFLGKLTLYLVYPFTLWFTEVIKLFYF